MESKPNGDQSRQANAHWEPAFSPVLPILSLSGESVGIIGLWSGKGGAVVVTEEMTNELILDWSCLLRDPAQVAQVEQKRRRRPAHVQIEWDLAPCGSVCLLPREGHLGRLSVGRYYLQMESSACWQSQQHYLVIF